ncbi:hypothetical protein KCP76_02740 [Salmonella enterica subsp. enterica serovar Weltevreden]|nr:hypothetical protein KCP76_02740 [Salmonella enterica subsp. enterica serovar Weltevreden]
MKSLITAVDVDWRHYNRGDFEPAYSPSVMVVDVTAPPIVLANCFCPEYRRHSAILQGARSTLCRFS